MRSNKRKTQFPIPPSLVNANNEWQRIAQTADKAAISDKIYRGEIEENGKKKFVVRDLLRIIYHDKCAYCELKSFAPDVEHYRPKKRVTRVKSHPGYYWLCYEWSNLIPSCEDCNRLKGKANQFPILGVRVVSPPFLTNGDLDENRCKASLAPLINERPYLLHPEIDETEEYFTFTNRGKIRGRDAERRGKETIKICDLNRNILIYRRMQILKNDILVRINDHLLLYSDIHQNPSILKEGLRLIFQNLQNKTNRNEELSLFSMAILRNFDYMIIPFLKEKQHKKMIRGAFQAFSNGDL